MNKSYMYQVTVNITYPKYNKKMSSKCNWLLYKASFSFRKVHSNFIMIFLDSTIKASFILSHADHAHVLSFMPSLSILCQFTPGSMIQSQQCFFPTTLPLDWNLFFALFFTPYFYYIKLTLYLYF